MYEPEMLYSSGRVWSSDLLGEVRKGIKCQENDRLGTRQHRSRGVWLRQGVVRVVSCSVHEDADPLYRILLAVIRTKRRRACVGSVKSMNPSAARGRCSDLEMLSKI